MIDVELKNILNDLANRFVKMLNVGVLTDELTNQLKKSYDKGLNEAENQFNMNFVRDELRLQSLQKYTFDNIKDMNEDIANKLRQVISRGILNFDKMSVIADQVKQVMDVSVVRARMIARTESNRATNMGHIDAARQVGLPMVKQWIAYDDAKTSAVCKYLDNKTVKLDEKFTWLDSKGVIHEYDTPPAHTYCRSTVAFKVDIKIKEKEN